MQTAKLKRHRWLASSGAPAMHIFQLTSATVLWTICCANVSLASAAEVSIRPVAITGDPAPGTEAGTVFWLFTNGLNHSMMHPVIDAEGHVAFVARVTGPLMQDVQRNGLWIERNGGLELVARSGIEAPGIGGDIKFSGFPSDYLPMPPLVSGGRIAFNVELFGPGVQFGNSMAMYKEGADGLEFIGRQGSHAAGFDPGFVYDTATFIGGYNAQGHVMLRGGVYGPGVTDDNDEAIWTDRSGAVAPVVREGQPAPGQGGLLFGRGELGSSQYALPQTLFNRNSQILFQGNLAGTGNYHNDEALWIESGGVITKILREGDPAPGAGAGVTFGGNSVSLSIFSPTFNSNAHSSFDIRLGGSVPTTSAMYSTHTGALDLVALPGDPAPGQSYEFGLLASPKLNENGDLAFRAATPDDDNDPFTQPPWALWVDRGGTLTLIAHPGDPIVNAPGWTLESAGQLFGFNSAGQIAMTAPLFDDLGQQVYQSLLISDDAGNLYKVVAINELFDVHGDGSDLRPIVRIIPGGLSDTGHVVFRLDFSDTESGHYVASIGVPAVCAADIASSAGAGADDSVDIFDLFMLLANWNTNGPGANLASPGDVVDVLDLFVMLKEWGSCP